jgi:hypothetical protein
MSASVGAPRPARWAPSAYQAAVVLSGTSAVLGLGRELLILHRLGLSTANDGLQFALSVTYTIALLGEPLRLAALNLLDRRIGARISAVIGGAIVLAALLMTVLYAAGKSALPVTWLVAAGTAGAANLVLAWVLPRLQRAGPFLPVHAVTVMPNIFISAGLLLPAASDESFAARVIGLFLLAPIVQLSALAILSRFGDHPPVAPAPTVRDGLRPVVWHAVGAGGGQAAQLFLRTALLAAPAGTLAAFVLVLRVTDTIRAVFVDTYIASHIRRWAAGERTANPAVDGRWLSPALLLALVLAGLLVSVFWVGRQATLLTPATVVLLLGTYLVLALRVRYQSLNTSAQPLQFVRRMAGLELSTAAVTGVLGYIPGLPVALLPWMVYLTKPAAGLCIIPAQASGAAALTPES